MTAIVTLGRVDVDTPLMPSPDQASTLLRRELLRPEYHTENPIQTFIRWLGRQFESGLDKASAAPGIGSWGALVAFLAVVVLLGWLASRARTSARAPRSRRAVLTEERVTATELRARALAALAQNDASTAVVEGFRALTLRQIEMGVLEEQPGATAHEVALALGKVNADLRTRVEYAADLFDLVLYGDRLASTDQAEAVIGLDDDLVAVR